MDCILSQPGRLCDPRTVRKNKCDIPDGCRDVTRSLARNSPDLRPSLADCARQSQVANFQFPHSEDGDSVRTRVRPVRIEFSISGIRWFFLRCNDAVGAIHSGNLLKSNKHVGARRFRVSENDSNASARSRRRLLRAPLAARIGKAGCAGADHLDLRSAPRPRRRSRRAACAA